MSTRESLSSAAHPSPRAASRGRDPATSGFLAISQGSRVTADELMREVEEYFALGAVVRPGDTVIDVGANVGAFALRVAELTGSDVHLYCFEPSPTTFDALSETFLRNPVLQRTRHRLLRRGLTSGDHAGQHAKFYNFRRFPTNSTLDLESKRREFEMFFEHHAGRMRERWGAVGGAVGQVFAALPKGRLGRRMSDLVMGLEEVDVELETLDAAITREKIERVDLLKIDVEGHEPGVLRGLGPASWPKVQQVVLETHDRDGRQSQMLALLAEHGLTEVHVAAQKVVDNGLESNVILATRPR